MKKNVIILLTVLILMLAVPPITLSTRNIFNKFPSTCELNLINTSKNLKENKEKYINFKILDRSTGEITEIPDKEFLYGTLAAEMPASFELEALKAQTIVSFTHFCRLREESRKKNTPSDFEVDTQNWLYYVSKDQMQERFKTLFEEYYKKITQAVDSVLNQVIKYHDELILAVCHPVSSGNTESSSEIFGGDLPYLINVPSPGDLLAPDYKNLKEFTQEEIKNKLTEKFPDINFNNAPETWFSDETRTEAGSIKTIKINLKELSVKELRDIFSLKSANFTVNYNKIKNKFIFITKGIGHGVGMSQYGAHSMAQQGSDYKEILFHYFPETDASEYDLL